MTSSRDRSVDNRSGPVCADSRLWHRAAEARSSECGRVYRCGHPRMRQHARMHPSALALLLASVAALSACSDDASVPDPPTSDPWGGRLWSLVNLNGEAVPYGPGKGDVFATRTGSVIWFEAGCGFSVSVHQGAPVVRDPHRTSRPCSPTDLNRLAAVEAMMRDGGSISADQDKVVINAGDGRSAMFEAQSVWDPSE